MATEVSRAALAPGAESQSLFAPGRNCWRAARARRASILVDGEAYFTAFAQAALQAQRSIVILAWDFNSGTRLVERPSDHPELLGDFLNFLVRRRRSLEVRVLIWDYPMIFGTDREFPPVYGLGWSPHRRVRVRYDNTHPFTGSHHQKVVVVDDRLAFCGGFDLTCKRWDSNEHLPGDERRVSEGKPYPPFHDVMMMVDGDVARCLGTLARDRWQRATGRPAPIPGTGNDPWPRAFRAEFRDVDVAISRTIPESEQRSSVREVEQLYIDMIASARRSIYLENQYFTSHTVGDALEARLREAEGPEVVVVVRLLSHGWLEEVTMQNLRRRLVERLRNADLHGRLRIYYPHIAGLAEGTCIDVHSKVLIVDDEWLRVGSSNVSNRSMGFDSECDLTIEARGRPDVQKGVRGCRERLLAEHLGKPVAELRAALRSSGSLAKTVEQLHSEARTLQPLHESNEIPEAVLDIAGIADPEQPVTLDNLIAQFSPRTAARARFGIVTRVIAAIALIAGLAGIWHYTPLATLLTPEHITTWAHEFANRPWAPLIVLGAFPVAAVLMFPRPLITLFSVVAFGPWLGFAYSMSGILLAAFLTYVAGMRFERDTVRRMGGPRLNRVIKVLRHRGLIAVAALRLVPLAPFAVEGVVAGAIRIPLWQFMLGTALGMLPGTLATTVFGDQLHHALSGSGDVNVWLLVAVVVLLVLGALGVRRWFITSQIDGDAAPPR